MPRRDLRAGDYVGERYRIVGKPLRGGMGVVFIVQDLESDSGNAPQRTLYALKSLTSDTWNSPESETFKREIAAWLGLVDHPNVIKAHDIVTFKEQPYLILEYAAGGNLAQLLRRALPEGAAILKIAANICHGMTHLHRSGLIHRDLKPSNVLFDESGIAHVTDLGLSRAVRITAVASIPKSFVGTLQYASPEHFVALTECDEQSDIYSFGALLYELVCGRPVFVAKSFHEYRRLHLEEAPFPPSKRKGLAERQWQTLKTVVDRCLAKRRDERYRTFWEVLDALGLPQSPTVDREVRARADILPDDSTDAVTKADALSRVGLYAEALAVLERSATTGPGHWRLQGQCHFALGAAHEAVVALTQAAEADPHDQLTKHGLAACLVSDGERETVKHALERHATRHLPELAVSHGFAYLLSFHEFESALLGYLEVVRRLEANRSWDYCVVVFEWQPPRFFRYAVLIGAPYKQSEALGELLARVPGGDLEVLYRPAAMSIESSSPGAAFEDVIRHSRSLAWTSHVSRDKVKFSTCDIETDVWFLDRRIPLALVRLGVAKLDPTLVDDVVALVYTINNIETRRLVAKPDAPPGFLGRGSIAIDGGKIYNERNMWETERRSRTIFLDTCASRRFTDWKKHPASARW